MSVRLSIPLGIFAAIVCGSSSFADTDTNTLTVNLNVVRTCTIDSGILSFPTDTFVTAIQSNTATITVTCNGDSSVPTVNIGVGSNALAGVVPRRMKLATGPEFLSYTLTSGSTAIVTDTGMPLTDNGDSTYSADIYATTTVPDTATIGSYSDSVVMTLTYPQLTRLIACLALIATLAWAAVVSADEFSVSPTKLRVPATDRFATLTVMSSGSAMSVGQVRVMRWHNENGRNDLEPTRAVTASPPSIQMNPNQEITIRLVRKSKKPVRGEECYRVLIDKLPNLSGGEPQVAFTVRHSVPLCFGKKP